VSNVLETAGLDLATAEELIARVDWKRIRRILDRFRVIDGKGFRLKHFDPDDTAGALLNKQEAAFVQQWGVEQLAKWQEKLYAEATWSLLCIFQATDAAGKDGTIKHVMSGVNPQGVQVHAFKSPGPEQLAHDFLWRIHQALPERGKIGIFNRSHYEEVLAVRVHPEYLERQQLPSAPRGKKFWAHRMEDIAAFERYLSRQGILILKFFLHVSKEEQKRRLLARLEEPEKNWKFSATDLAERDFWDAYQDAAEQAIAATAAPHAPWFVVPADNKWFTRLFVVAAIVDTLQALDPNFPEITGEQRDLLTKARRQLELEN
jgi:PPK2 family polyphosphate:nucleotide phosphotransferase